MPRHYSFVKICVSTSLGCYENILKYRNDKVIFVDILFFERKICIEATEIYVVCYHNLACKAKHWDCSTLISSGGFYLLKYD